MKIKLKYVLPTLGIAAAAVGLNAFLIAPGRAEPEKKAPFFGVNIAHRGLHRADRSVPENSMAAFTAAAESGYGIELDVHLTADDRLAVFHDDSLMRMCGVPKRIDDCTSAELQEYTLAGTQERIPLLCEVLAAIGGKSPIVLELKRGRRSRRLCELTYAAVKAYNGDICVESFDPLILRWWRFHAPEVLRGQLSCPMSQFSGLKRAAAFVLSRLLTNFLCRPQFVAYGLEGKKPLNVRLCEKLGAMKVAWTSRGWGNEEENDAVIFEFYRPRTRFK